MQQPTSKSFGPGGRTGLRASRFQSWTWNFGSSAWRPPAQAGEMDSTAAEERRNTRRLIIDMKISHDGYGIVGRLTLTTTYGGPSSHDGQNRPLPSTRTSR